MAIMKKIWKTRVCVCVCPKNLLSSATSQGSWNLTLKKLESEVNSVNYYPDTDTLYGTVDVSSATPSNSHPCGLLNRTFTKCFPIHVCAISKGNSEPTDSSSLSEINYQLKMGGRGRKRGFAGLVGLWEILSWFSKTG